MTYQEISDAVGEIAGAAGCPHTYYQWAKGSAPEPPYVLFYYPERRDLFADDENYISIVKLNLELYTDAKDPERELRLEAALAGAGFSFLKSETYLESESMYEVLYETEVILDGE